MAAVDSRHRSFNQRRVRHWTELPVAIWNGLDTSSSPPRQPLGSAIRAREILILHGMEWARFHSQGFAHKYLQQKYEQTCLANISITFFLLFLAVFLALHVFPLTSVSLENSFPWHFFLLRTLSLHISFSWYYLFTRLSSTLFLLWRWLYLFYVNVFFLSSFLVFSILVHFLLDFLSSRCCMCTCQKHPSFERLGAG